MAVMMVIATTPARASIPTYDPVFYYYHGDHLGSTSLMTDRGGNLVQHYGYTAFGKECYRDNDLAFSVSNRFTDQILDEETGLYYYGGRYYDPEIGRFIQPDIFVPDPLDAQSHNRFAYVRNNPLNRIDPTGFLDKPDGRETDDFLDQVSGGDLNNLKGANVQYDSKSGKISGWYAERSGMGVEGSWSWSDESGWMPDGTADFCLMDEMQVDGGPESNAAPAPTEGPSGKIALDFMKGVGEDFVTSVAIGGAISLGIAALPAAAPVVAVAGIAMGAAALGNWAGSGFPVSARGAGQVIGCLAGGGIAAAASKAALGALGTRAAGSIKYHYTRAPESSFKTLGFLRNHSATDTLFTSAEQASQELGIPRPNKIIPVRDRGHFRPNAPRYVRPSNRYIGGGTDFVNPHTVPPDDILPAIPIN